MLVFFEKILHLKEIMITENGSINEKKVPRYQFRNVKLQQPTNQQ